VERGRTIHHTLRYAIRQTTHHSPRCAGRLCECGGKQTNWKNALPAHAGSLVEVQAGQYNLRSWLTKTGELKEGEEVVGKAVAQHRPMTVWQVSSR
jgi:hypothetical protein